METMNRKKRGLAIVLHSGSYDRLYHGLSLAVAALAQGKPARLFFSYWALEYLRKDKPATFALNEEAEVHRALLEKAVKGGHILPVVELLRQVKAMGGMIYACSSSMGLLNVARGELADIADKSMGITTFLSETAGDQTLFV